MFFLKCPKWINLGLLSVERLEDLEPDVIKKLSQLSSSRLSDDPVVSIVIAALNEELNIVRCIDSLLNNTTRVPFEIIVVNNNSVDRTQEVTEQLRVRHLLETKPGAGPARELGQQNARGKYVLLADADSLYPPTYIDEHYQVLSRKDVVCTYGHYSFINSSSNPRWKYALYEGIRRIIIELRNINRPYLNALGMNMGYVRELGVREGFLERNIRGEDGRMCFDLMKYGKVVMLRSRKSRVWTSDRTLSREGSLYTSLKKRLLRELVRFEKLITKPAPDDDTKTSENEEYSIEESTRILKKRLNPFKKK